MADIEDGALESLRKELSICAYEPAPFIKSQIADVDLEDDLESKLLIIFDGLANELAIHTESLESEVSTLRGTAQQTNHAMLEEMENHALRLDDVRTAVDDVKTAFERASEGAIKIGDRLSVSESERKRLEMSVNLISFINWFDAKPENYFFNVNNMDLHELKRTCVPEALREKTWGDISQMLGYLRRVLFDLSSDFAQIGLRNILRVSEAAEQALLTEFLQSLGNLMDSNNSGEQKEIDELTSKCRELVAWLHTYNSGQTLHKRFIYAVIEKRMPRGVLQFEPSSNSLSRQSSAFGADHQFAHDVQHHAPESVDYLSELFGSISSVCTEQFTIIRNIFPAHAVPKMSRTLVQRIYNDPAFGIQGRVDNVLHPKPPFPALPVADYLESLLTVREKLAALYMILLDLCSHPAMQGMGRENSRITTHVDHSDNDFAADFAEKTLNAPSNVEALAESAAAAREKSSIEVQDFLEEQISHVLSSYMGDYFDKEFSHIRTLYAESLRKLFHSGSADVLVIYTGLPGQVPRLNAERVRSIADLVSTVSNSDYLSQVLQITNDVVKRIQSVARDEARLDNMMKDTYMLQLEFFIDNVMLPSMQACTHILLKQASKGPSNTVLPPTEFLNMVEFVCSTSAALKSNLENDIMPILHGNSNLIVVCKESLRSSLKPLDALNKEAMAAYRTCIIHHCDRLLISMQSKGDYGKTFLRATHSHDTQSAACLAVSKALRSIAAAVREHSASIQGLDMKENFSKPIGRHFMSILIAHLRRMSISEEGSKTLIKDIDEYLAVMKIFDSKENVDMMHCLREIVCVFEVSQDRVKKVVTEDLRHLDTDVVLALTKARSDYGIIQKNSEHWTRTIASTYSFTKWDHEPTWEKRSPRRHTNSLISGLLSQNTEQKSEVPISLRKTGAPVSSLYIELQQTRTNHIDLNSDPTDPAGTSSMDIGSQDEQLFNITGASSFAAAMQSRYSHFAKPGSSFMPSRPHDTGKNERTGSSPTNVSEEENRSSLSDFRPLTFLSNAIGVSRPDLVGQPDNSLERSSVSLMNRARSNLGLTPTVLGKAAKEAPAAATESGDSSLTPMRDSMRNVMSTMGGWGKSLTPEKSTKTSDTSVPSKGKSSYFSWGK
jgi:hypothetical protein